MAKTRRMKRKQKASSSWQYKFEGGFIVEEIAKQKGNIHVAGS